MEPITMLEKLNKATPYNIFSNEIPSAPATQRQDNTISFHDLLCPSLGVLKCSLQINFVIGPSWLMKQYFKRNVGRLPLTLVHGHEYSPELIEDMKEHIPNVTQHFVNIVGCHHSKISIFAYEDDSLRVVVSTANLYYEDWEEFNQQLWVSPLCPRISDDTPGESPTNFKLSLLTYLKHYNLPILDQWISSVEKADFSQIKVFLVTSVPGTHHPESGGSHVHTVGELLQQYCSLPREPTQGPLSWTIIAQASSLGGYFRSPALWLRTTFLRSLARHDQGQMAYIPSANLKIIYPTDKNVRDGTCGLQAGRCLNYSLYLHRHQKWIESYFHQWKSDALGRSRNVPHQKLYCRISPCETKLAWYLLTSANLSRAAWGSKLESDMKTSLKNYEAGVMFFPKFFEENFFEISVSPKNINGNVFPFILDLPLTRYGKGDTPWFSETIQKEAPESSSSYSE